MANKQSQEGENISSAQAVFLGALAPGVNVSFLTVMMMILSKSLWWLNELMNFQAPTWTTLRLAFVMLGVCLAVMLGLAFSSSDSWLVLHVAFLVLITMTLFLLLSWYWTLVSNTHNSFSLKPFTGFAVWSIFGYGLLWVVWNLRLKCFTLFVISSAVCFGCVLALVCVFGSNVLCYHWY